MSSFVAYVFCHTGVLVCLFVVNVANFWYAGIEIGYRILNCIMNLRSFIFGFYLSLGIPQLLFKVIFVAVSVLSTHSYLEFICVGCYCARFFVRRNGTTDFAKTGQVSDDTINLINC